MKATPTRLPPDVSEVLTDLVADMLVREYEHRHGEAEREVAAATVAAPTGRHPGPPLRQHLELPPDDALATESGE